MNNERNKDALRYAASLGFTADDTVRLFKVDATQVRIWLDESKIGINDEHPRSIG